jgi:hypothetical protein
MNGESSYTKQVQIAGVVTDFGTAATFRRWSSKNSCASQSIIEQIADLYFVNV